jgi:hypothetical protein
MSRSAVAPLQRASALSVAGRSTAICALSRPLRRLHTAAQTPPAAGGISCGRGGEITSGPGGTTTSGPGCGKSGPFSGCGSSDGVGGRTTSGSGTGIGSSGRGFVGMMRSFPRHYENSGRSRSFRLRAIATRAPASASSRARPASGLGMDHLIARLSDAPFVLVRPFLFCFCLGYS